MTPRPPGAVTVAVGANVRGLRELRGFSQHEVARRLGWKGSMLGRLERGLVNMTVEQLVVLARVLGVAPSTLLRGVK